MSPKPNLARRRVLAGVLALPAVGVVGCEPAFARPHDDAELLELGRQYDAQVAAVNALDKACMATQDRVEALTPAKPEALRIRPGDWFAIPHSGPARDRLGGYFDAGCVFRLRQWDPDRHTGFRPQREQAEARRLEILTAWDGWDDARERLTVSTGLRDLEAKASAAGEALYALETRIMDTRAHTLDGLRLKARAALRVLGDEPDGTYEEHLCRKVLADLTADTGQGA